MSDFTGEIIKEVNTAELEFNAAFYLEQKLVAEKAPEVEIFMARQDRMAKELVCMEQSGQTNDYPSPVVEQPPTPIIVKKPLIEKIEKPPILTPKIKPVPIAPSDEVIDDNKLTGSIVIHKSYRHAAEAAIQISRLVEKEDLHDIHGLPLGGYSHDLEHDYEIIIGEALAGIRVISEIPKPYTPLMHAKAKQALSSIAGDTDDELKTDEWTERFFELQVSLCN